MSDFLATLNNPKAAEAAANWEAEVAKAGEADTTKPTEPEKPAEVDVSHETKPTETQPAATETKQEVEPKEDKQVPLKALHEEREARKALERKLAELEQRFQRPVTEEQPKEEAPPDPETDPIGALKYMQKKSAEFQQQQQFQTYQQNLAGALQASLHSYLETEPAFKDAYEHALKSRAAELRAYGTPEGELDAILKTEQLQITEAAIKQGKNPAEIIYKFAEARGFQKKAQEQQKPAAAATDPALEKAKADAALSLNSGGKPPTNELTEEEALRTLKGAALDAWIEKRWKAMEQTSGRKSALFAN